MKKRAGYRFIALLLCFVLAVCGITAALTVGAIRFAYPMKYENYIDKYSAQYDVPKTLLFAVIKTESSFDPKAESSAGGVGADSDNARNFSLASDKDRRKFKRRCALRPGDCDKIRRAFPRAFAR